MSNQRARITIPKSLGDLRVEEYCLLGCTAETSPIDVRLVRMTQREGPDLWAIREHGMVMNHVGLWEHEPMPSSRTDAFMERCRFRTRLEAFAVWLKAPEKTRFARHAEIIE